MYSQDELRGRLKQIWDRAVQAWDDGKRSPETLFPAGSDDRAFLAEIGCSAREMFDFVDDHREYGEPDFDTAAAVTAIRYRYLVEVMNGKRSGNQATMDDLPPKTEAVDGIAWLPRLMVKARLKLRGEMPDDLMFGCGGDRPFLAERNITLPEFLQLVWDSGDDDERIVQFVKRRSTVTAR